MKPPIQPKQEDCCNSGCNPCIFDVYEKQLLLYKSYVECGTNNLSLENAISPLEYKQFVLVESIDICKQHKLLLYKLDEPDAENIVFWHPGEHFLVKYETEKYTCSRAYTPLKIEHVKREHDFAIIIKRYDNGLVSNYLCDMQAGQSSLWRGPYGHYQLNSEKYCRIIMIAQGTGIAPLYSILTQILNDEENMTKVILLYCCKCIDTILLRDELYSLKSYWNFEYVIHLSNPSEGAIMKYKEPISTTKLTDINILNLKPFTGKDQFLICGSNDFLVEYSKLLQEKVSCVNVVKF